MNALSGFALLPACFAGAKVRILHNHTTDIKDEKIRSLIKKLLRPFAKLFANQYWACSKLAAEWMYGKKILASGKVIIINNAIDLEKFKFNKEKRKKLRMKLGLEKCFVTGAKYIVKAQKLYFFDTGLAAYLTRWLNADALEAGAASSEFFETWVVTEIYKGYANKGIVPPFVLPAQF